MAPSATLTHPTMASEEGLTADQLALWDTNGYLIIEDALDQQTVAALLKETHRMLDEDLDLKNHPMTKFSTGEGEQDHVGDDYFLESGDKVRFFFEEGMYSLSISVWLHKQHKTPSLSSHSVAHINASCSNTQSLRGQTHLTPKPPP